MSSETVMVYIRNSQKIGKILHLVPTIQADQLYHQAACTQNLSQEDVHLYLEGKMIPRGQSQISLKEKAIIHIVNLMDSNKDSIEVSVRTIEGKANLIKIQVDPSITIRQFIDEKLYKVFGEKSDKLLLIHIGRQLNMDRSLKQEDIQDGSELFCVNIEQLKAKKKEGHSRSLRASRQNLGTQVTVKQISVPEQPKDIYPTPSFPIEVPTDVTTNNNFNLIFDAKIHHTSSLPDYSLPPEETIIEEDTNLIQRSSEQAKEEEIPNNNEESIQREKYSIVETNLAENPKQNEEELNGVTGSIESASGVNNYTENTEADLI